MGGVPQACILVRNIHVFNIMVSRNTISKGSGAGIKLFNVKASSKNMSLALEIPKTIEDAEDLLERCTGTPERVEILDNYIIETVDGYGMVIDTSTCKLEQNQLKKNAYGGLLLTTTLRPEAANHLLPETKKITPLD